MTTTAARQGAPAQSRPAGWALVTVGYGYALLYFVCGYLALSHAADLAGRWHIPAQGDAVTADLDVNAGWGLSLVTGMVLSIAPMIAALGLLASALFFLLGVAGGNRRLMIALLGSTAAMLLTLVVSLTPAAQSLAGWLLD